MREELMIEEAAHIFGGMSKLAAILGVSRATLYNWMHEDVYTIYWYQSDYDESDSFVNHLIVEKEVLTAGVPDGRETRCGYVYCVSNGSHMKIGRTRNPAQRIKQVENGFIIGATKEYLSPVVSDCCELELMALRKFSDVKVHGEIFLDRFDEAVEFISKNCKPINTGMREKKPTEEMIIKRAEEHFNAK